MKKTILVTVAALAAVALALAVIPTTRDEIHWCWASHKNQLDSYESYVKTWREGRHAAEAQARCDQFGWQDAQTANTVEGFEQYVQLHGEGKHVAEAKDSIESLHWQEATKDNTIRSYRVYTERYPQGRFAPQAKTKLSTLRVDQAPFVTVLQTGTETSLKQFLTDFPGHAKEADAKQRLREITEGRDIVDLLKEKKIEISTQGSGIQRVTVSVRRRVPYSLTVRIPLGTYFVSANSSSQNMVTTAESRIRLDTEDWQDVSPDAACANRLRDIPGGNDHFTVQRSPHQAELAQLIPVLDKERVDIATKQAAVWIITDNADYDDLGILVASQFGFGGSRAINEPEAARAMRICDQAGIDITRKRIWNDKEAILRELADGELRKWLEKKR